MSPALQVAEPPPRYRIRPPIVVDCSVMVGALFQEHWRDTALQHIAGRDLHAPFLLQAEFASVCVKKSRQGQAELATDALEEFRSLTTELHRIEEHEVVALAQRFQLSAYDASYLWLAGELRYPLITFDDRLADAARQHLAGLP